MKVVGRKKVLAEIAIRPLRGMSLRVVGSLARAACVCVQAVSSSFMKGEK